MKCFLTTAILFLVLCRGSGMAEIISPTEKISTTIENVRAVVKDPLLRGDTNKKVRRETLRKIILPIFDFVEFSKMALGSYWRKIDAQKQQEFVALFKELLAHAYLGQVESLDDEKFIFRKELVEGDRAEVRSRVLTTKGDFEINYKLHKVVGEWEIYDLVIENISIANNYRAQFTRRLSGITFDDLLGEMRKLVKHNQDRYG